MGKTFAIADLHGRFDLLTKAIERIESGNPAGGKVVFLGDYVDRGPESAQIIERLMGGPDDPSRWKWVCLKGNHEDMMVSTLGGPDEAWWLGNGGTATLASYNGAIPQQHLNWCKSLPTWHEDTHRVFVHAAVDPTRALNEQSEAMLMWTRYGPEFNESYRGKHIVHGHTPHENGPICLSERTNLDTGAVFTGRLVVAVFDDEVPGGPRSFIKLAS